jgi:putative oxidoreductase
MIAPPGPNPFPGLPERLDGSGAPPGFLVLKTDDAPATILIRVLVGWVFVSEGIQKFLFPGVRGAGRFESIGLPFPDFLGTLVGGFELACGLLLLLGLGVRVAALPLVTIMLVALWTTKVPILMADGFWVAAHAARTDASMLLGSLFLLWVGGGARSLDRYFWTRASTPPY